ncbi:uncharacterized protein RHO25_013181 [Cercospora beticola]|uniref:Uncharacterized protein n=1 Tax=Cercospora beticola TaxID=122368 RepID=A0ABZ0P9N4_CERBT|nr:hypothetical protein RHO25_013181 [Cercospora beticola]
MPQSPSSGAANRVAREVNPNLIPSGLPGEPGGCVPEIHIYGHRSAASLATQNAFQDFRRPLDTEKFTPAKSRKALMTPSTPTRPYDQLIID